MTSQATDPHKKHRHDVGAPDHEPETTEATTRGIQVILGAAILMTASLMAYAVIVAGGAG